MQTHTSYEETLCSNKHVKWIFLLYVLGIIVQDLPTQISLGTIARSPYIFLSPIVFFIISALSFRFYFEKEIRYYLIYYVYSLFIAMFLIFWYVGLSGYSMNIYGEHLVVKFMKSSMYNLIILLTLYNLIFIFKFSSVQFAEKLLKALILVQLFIGFVQLVLPKAFDLIKTPQLLMTDRLTLLNTEPSQAFPQLLVSLLCYLGMRIYNKRINAVDFLIFTSTFFLLVLIQSKGGLILILICSLIIIFFTKQKLKNRLKLFAASLIFLIPTAFVVVTIIIPGFFIDMEKDIGSFASVSTRAVTIHSSLISLISHPFGQGYSTYLITFPKLLEKSLNTMILWGKFPISSFEIDWMLYTGRAMTVKSGVLNEVLYTGWAILIFYFIFFRQSFIRLKSLRYNRTVYIVFRFILLFIIINYLLVTNLETSYIAFLPFAVLIKLHRESIMVPDKIEVA